MTIYSFIVLLDWFSTPWRKKSHHHNQFLFIFLSLTELFLIEEQDKLTINSSNLSSRNINRKKITSSLLLLMTRAAFIVYTNHHSITIIDQAALSMMMQLYSNVVQSVLTAVRWVKFDAGMAPNGHIRNISRSNWIFSCLSLVLVYLRAYNETNTCTHIKKEYPIDRSNGNDRRKKYRERKMS